MSNRPGICWECIHREDCKMFKKDPDANVTECGRFIMNDADKAIIKAICKEINTDRPIERGIELVPVGRLETQDEYLLDILKEQGFYLMCKKRETAYTELEYYQVLYPKEG